MKKFAKLMSVVLAIAMLFAMAIPVASVAAEGEVAIMVETVEANAGDSEVEVKLFISAEPHWSAIDVTFNFDPEKISFVEEGFETNEAVSKQLSGGKPSIFALNEEKAAEGEVLIAFASSVTDGGYEGYYNVDRKGNVYDYFGTFLFDVADGATGLQEITVTVGKLVDAAGDNVQYVATKGGIQLPGGDEPPVDPCDHEWTEWEVTTPATCVAKGEKTRTCTKCQEKETEEIDIDPDAHDWGEWTDSPDKEGWEQRVCKNDPTHIEEREKGSEPPQPGEGVAIVVETVEANAGDSEVEVKLFIAAEPHWSAIDVTFNFDPTKLTFVEEGFETNEAVSKQLSGGKPAIFALNEEKAAEGEVLIAFASSVTDGGYEGYYNVDRKGNVYDYFGTFLFDVAEGLEDGLYEITVTVGKFVDAAGDNVEFNTTNGGIRIGAAACEHDWVETGRTPATCTEAGSITYTCSKCQATREETIDPLGHDWGEWEVTTPATCTEKGEETRTCQREGCDATETREIEIDPEAHKWIESGREKATCAAEGKVTYYCENNPDHMKEETLPIDPDAHDWGEWEDCADEPGFEQRVCKNDPSHIEKREKGSEPPVHEHTFGEPTYTWAEDNSTCTATRTCTGEGCEETETETVNTTSETTPATTEAEGKTVYTATFTNSAFETQTKEVTIPKLNPEEPTAPAVTGITDGQEFDLGKGEKPAPTWEPADATATLNGKPYTAGTEIAEAGDYELVVTDGEGNATTIKFKVTDSSATNPDQPNTSDLPVAGIAIVSMIAAAAVVVIARKKRFAR